VLLHQPLENLVPAESNDGEDGTNGDSSSSTSDSVTNTDPEADAAAEAMLAMVSQQVKQQQQKRAEANAKQRASGQAAVASSTDGLGLGGGGGGGRSGGGPMSNSEGLALKKRQDEEIAAAFQQSLEDTDNSVRGRGRDTDATDAPPVSTPIELPPAPQLAYDENIIRGKGGGNGDDSGVGLAGGDGGGGGGGGGGGVRDGGNGSNGSNGSGGGGINGGVGSPVPISFEQQAFMNAQQGRGAAGNGQLTPAAIRPVVVDTVLLELEDRGEFRRLQGAMEETGEIAADAMNLFSGRVGELIAFKHLQDIFAPTEGSNSTVEVEWLNADAESMQPFDILLTFRESDGDGEGKVVTQQKKCEVKTRMKAAGSDQQIRQWFISTAELAQAQREGPNYFCFLLSIEIDVASNAVKVCDAFIEGLGGGHLDRKATEGEEGVQERGGGLWSALTKTRSSQLVIQVRC
jgi:hypothetical protein